jgi:hypothetical protein
MKYVIGVIKVARIDLKIIIIAVLIGSLVMLPACSSKDEPAKKPQTSSQQKNKAPQEMKSILADLETILSGLEQKIKTNRASTLQKNTQLAEPSQQGEQGQSQSGQSGQGQGQQDQSQGTQGSAEQQNQQEQGQSQPQAGQQSQISGWQKEDTSIKNIHRNWNALEPEAIKAGLATKDRDGFEQALEKLTLSVAQRKQEESLTAAIELYGQYANLVRVFSMPIPAEFFQLKYQVMMAVSQATKKDWAAAEQHIPQIQESWTHLKVKAQKQDGKSVSRTEFSLHDLEQALKRQELDLLLIKAEVVMDNLQKMQKELSQSSGGT